MIFGVDSLTPSTSNMADGTVFYDYVNSCTVQDPLAPLAFWGRYIGKANGITAAEGAQLHTWGLRILVIYNATLNSPNSVQGGVPEGQNDAQIALQAAKALGIPTGVAIFADVENTWAVTSDWITGWATTIAADPSGYVPGFYCNSNKANSVFAASYCTAVAAAVFPAFPNTLLYSCNPANQGAANFYRPGAVSPTATDCQTPTLWQYALSCYQPSLNPKTDPNFTVDLDCADDSLLAVMW
jgi:hypothetical protein